MTKMRSEHPRAEVLLAHAGWIRHLARHLVRDPDLAEDVAQDACVSALEGAPDQPENLRSWLRTVVRNVVAQRHRSETRRQTRERMVARTLVQPSTAEVCSRLNVFRELLDALHELDEPYLSTLTLRFLEELPPRAVATRLGISVKTVHTRIERGLQKLRASLDKRHGSRRAWATALLPLFPSEAAAGASLTAVGVLLMHTKILAGVAVLLGVAGVFLWSLRGDGGVPEPRTGDVVHARLESEPANPGSPDESRKTTMRRQLSAMATVTDQPANTAEVLRGRVVDLRSQPVPAVKVVFHHGDDLATAVEDPLHQATTDAGGWFEMGRPERIGVLAARGAGIATLFAVRLRPADQPKTPILVVGPAIDLHGQVSDAEGRLVDGARARVVLPLDSRGRFKLILDHAVDPWWNVRTEKDGRFDLRNIVPIGGAHLLVSKDGYLPSTQPLPAASARLAVVLHRPKVSEGALRGVVVDVVGLPLKGARVGLGDRSTTTDDQGLFIFEGMPQSRAKRLLAVVPGFLPAVMPRPKDETGKEAEWPDFVVLHVQEPALSIRGRVVDAAGRGLERMKVWIRNPDVFGRMNGRLCATENLIADAMSLERLLRKVRKLPDPADARRFFAKTPNRSWNFVFTGADGWFEITGVLPRAYVLTVMDPETLLQVDSPEVRGGDRNVRITVPAEAFHERVAGRVVDREGNGLRGVRVRPYTDGFSLSVDGQTTTMHADLDGVVTDETGRFVFARVPKTRVYLRLDGSDVIPLEYGRGLSGGIREASGGQVENLCIRMRQRIHVQVEIPGGPAVADGIEVLDPRGERLTINVFSGSGRNSVFRLNIREEHSPAFVVPEDATTLVFYKGTKEVSRQPLVLVAGKLNQVRY